MKEQNISLKQAQIKAQEMIDPNHEESWHNNKNLSIFGQIAQAWSTGLQQEFVKILNDAQAKSKVSRMKHFIKKRLNEILCNYESALDISALPNEISQNENLQKAIDDIVLELHTTKEKSEQDVSVFDNENKISELSSLLFDNLFKYAIWCIFYLT